MSDVVRLRIKLVHRDKALDLLRDANIPVVTLEERDGEARIEIGYNATDATILGSIPTRWWAIRGEWL